MPLRQISFKASIYQHLKGQITCHPIMVPGMGYILAGHSPAGILTMKGAAVSEGTHHAPHPAITELLLPFG